VRSIRARLALAFSCVIIFLVLQGAIGHYLAGSLGVLQRQVQEQELAVRDLQAGLDELRLTVFKLLGTMDPDEMDALRAGFRRRAAELRAALLELGVDPELVASSFHLYRRVIALHYDFSVKTARSLINSRSKVLHEELTGRLEEAFRRLQRQNLERVAAARRRTGWIFLGLLLAALAAATLWAGALARSLTDRRRAEAALREREEHLSTLVASSLDGIVTSDADRRITSCNQAFSRLYGYRPEELVGRTFEPLHPSPERYQEFGRLVYPAVEEKGFWRGEWVFRHKDGSLMQVELVISVQRREGRGPRGYVSIHRDITPRKEAEEKVRAERDRAQAYLDVAGVILLALDRRGRVGMVNRKGLEVLGYREEELVGRDWFELCLPPEERAEVREIFGRLMAGEVDQAGHAVNLVVAKDGSRRVVDWRNALIRDHKGRITGTLSSGEDITAQRKTEEELQQIFNMSLDMICIADINDIRFIKVNPAFTTVLGYSEEELLGKSFLEFIHPDDVEPTQRVVAEKLRRGDRVLHFENRYLKKDGGHVWLEWLSHPLPEQGITFAVAHDITQRRQAEKARALLEQQLRRSQKMEAVGTLAGGIAHDFNNILAAILGYTELALEANRQGRSTPHELEQIVVAAERAKDLVQRILAFSRKAETEFRPLDLNHEVRQAARLLERTIPRMIRIRLDLAAELPRMEGDASQLEQALLNLGANAKDAMPQGGTLTIATRAEELAPEFCQAHPWVEPGPHVRLTVADTGVGMDSETLEHIFEPFFTTKGLASGTGLGLAMVYGIAKSHRGCVTCQSAPGQGAAFHLHLPASDGAGPPAQAAAAGEAKGPRGTEAVLVVDDEEAIRHIAAQFLQASGYRTLEAASGEEALELWRRHGRELDLVVLDINMPGMGGYRCLEGILAASPGAKVIIASGYAQDGLISQALAAGALRYVAKPFRRAELLQAVREVLDRRAPAQKGG
jgi:PAS domain S-box-containing protein